MKASSFVWSLAIAGALVGCSSTPHVGTAQEQRADYIISAEKALDKWDEKITKLRSRNQSEVRAALADARAEIQAMKSSPDTSWATYRNRVDGRINHVESVYRRAAE